MDVFFKPVLVFIVVIGIFFYILSNSNTIETKTEVVTSASGMPMQNTSYIFHWDRFGAYVKNTPRRIKKYVSGSR
ncbi:MAG: hypothetical protein EOM80_16495 [Erysipelotrichia bacterium]|nr:hypothetical protein [Erysipelotrichia bacterium]